MINFQYGTCNRCILPNNRNKKQCSTRLHGWLISDKIENAAEAAAELALTAKEQLLVANGVIKNTTLVATEEILNISGNGTQLLGNLSAFASQLNFAGQGLIFSFSLYNAGICVTDLCLCPKASGKFLYGTAAVFSGASALTTGCSMSVGKFAPYSSYMLGMSGVAFRGIARYARMAARAQNPIALESIF